MQTTGFIMTRRRNKAWWLQPSIVSVRGVLGVAVLALALVPYVAWSDPAPVPEAELARLREEIAKGAGASMPSEARRAYKRAIRQAEGLLDASSGEVPNRFAVLGIVFEGQRRLLPLENSAENRAALFATAEALRQAPDAYAELRLGADLLLMEREMGERNARVAERIEVLKSLLKSYRNTPAEWDSLMIGSTIATRLQDFELVAQIEARMVERFAGDHTAIQYRRAKEVMHPLNVIFSGNFRTADGAEVSLPLDRWGRQYLAYFWSAKTPRIDDYLREVHELQKAHQDGSQWPQGYFEVISFNVDDLPDAGRQKLRSLGLDWEALHLPGGREHAAYRAYARTDPYAVFVNAQGHAVQEPNPEPLGITPVEGQREGLAGRKLADVTHAVDDERYQTQLRYLFAGDWLVGSGEGASTALAAEREAIDANFTAVPFRYRLTRDEALAKYTQIEKLSAAAIAQHEGSESVWMLRNRRIIALLGMWNLAGDAAHLEAAIGEAETVLERELPPDASIVARFCLVKADLRRGSDPELVLADFMVAGGGEKASAAVLAAAATLALEGSARSPHERYKARLLAMGQTIDEPLWPVRAFLLDRSHRFRNFWATPGGHFYDRQLGQYGYRIAISGLLDPLPRDFRIGLDLKKPDGTQLRIPADMPEKLLGVVVVEPPRDGETPDRLIGIARDFATEYQRHGAAAMVVVLSDDIDAANAFLQEGDDVEVALAPDGLQSPWVRKLGILSADQMPNLLLLRPDGTLAWQGSGFTYRYSERGGPDLPLKYAIRNNIEKIRIDAGFEALEQGDYQEALKRLDAFEPHHPKGDWWHADRQHGRALALMGLKDWEAALEAITSAISSRQAANRSGICACHGLVEMLLTQATILERLGRGDAADEARDLASQEVLPHSAFPPGEAFRVGVPVGVFYDRLKQIRLEMEKTEGNDA